MSGLRHGAVAQLAVVAVVVLGCAVAAAPIRAGAAPDPPELQLVSQDHLSGAPGGTITFTVTAPGSVDVTGFSPPSPPTSTSTSTPATDTSATGSVAPPSAPSSSPSSPPSTRADVPVDMLVTAYPTITTRLDVTAAIRRPAGNPISYVIVPATEVGHPGANQLAVAVSTNAGAPTDGVLWLPQDGLYPVTVEARAAGVVTARVITFVQRQPAANNRGAAPLSVALAVGTTAPVVLDGSGQVTFDDATIGDLTKLVEILETSRMPATVHVAPQLLAGLRNADPSLADRFAGVLGNATILSAPVLPLDPSAAAAAGQGQLYSDWLAAGEDLFGSADLPGTTLRAAAAVTGPLDERGGELLRGLGTRLLLLTPATYDTLQGSLGGYTTTELAQVRLADDSSLEAAVVDRRLGARLRRASPRPFQDAVYATADLLAARQEIIERRADPRRHSVLLGTDSLGIPDPATVAPLTELIATTPELAVSSVSQLSASTDVQLIDGKELTVRLPPDAQVASLASRLAVQSELRATAQEVASMLGSDDPRPAQWGVQLDRLPTTAFDDRQVQQITTSLRDELGGIRSAVQPPSDLAFTLTGRTGIVRLKLHNSASTPLDVRIRLDAAAGKLAFVDEQQRTLAANATTEVEINIRARSNGRFPVYLSVFAPADVSGDHPLAEARLTATVLGLTGLGNLVTGAALLMLLSWWLHHVRANRRRRATAASLDRHPVSAIGPTNGTPPVGNGLAKGGRSVDAATSTLPDS